MSTGRKKPRRNHVKSMVLPHVGETKDPESIAPEQVTECLGAILSNLPLGEIRSIVNTANLCVGSLSGRHPPGGKPYADYEAHQQCIRALEYLANHTKGCAVEDVHMVVDATWKLSLVVHFLKIRGEFPAPHH
jgi:hypothetical protein